jgi:hypothetical protein
MPKNKTGTKIKCPNCKYAWLTNSKMYFVPCPRCHRQIQLKSTKLSSDEKEAICEKESGQDAQHVEK